MCQKDYYNDGKYICYEYTHIYTYIYTYIHIYTYIYIYTYNMYRHIHMDVYKDLHVISELADDRYWELQCGVVIWPVVLYPLILKRKIFRLKNIRRSLNHESLKIPLKTQKIFTKKDTACKIARV